MSRLDALRHQVDVVAIDKEFLHAYTQTDPLRSVVTSPSLVSGCKSPPPVDDTPDMPPDSPSDGMDLSTPKLLTTRFKFEDGTRAHARIPARYMCRVIDEPVPCDKRGRVKLNDRDLSEYLNEVDYLAKRAERIRREEAAAKQSATKNN